MSPRPLDLRLLPAAAGTWAAAAAAVHLDASGALGLGLVLVGGAVLLGVLLAAVLRLLADDGRAGGSDTDAGACGRRMRTRTHPRSGRLRQTAVHLVLVCSLAGAAALTAGLELSGHEESGWSRIVEDQAPQQLTLRAASDPRGIAGTGIDGKPRAIVEVEVLTRREAEQPREVGASAVLLLGAEASATIRHGERLRGLLQSTPTDPGDRATALLTPFGESVEQLPADEWTHLWRAVESMRSAAAEAAESAPGEAPQLLPGMILGDRSQQSEELTTAMQQAGLSHLTAVSGANCALVLGAVLAGLRLLRLPRWCSPPAAVVTLGAFVLLVHPEPSVVRAAVMGGIGALALFAGRGRAAFPLLCVCVITLLVIDPWFAMEPAFALSAAATAGIVLIGTPLQRLLESVMPGWAASVLALACAAQLFVTPLLVPVAEGMSLYAIPANVLVAPLVPLVTVPGTAAAVLAPWLPSLAEAVLWCCGIPAALIAAVGRETAELPQAMVDWPGGGAGVVIGVLYVLAALALVRSLVLRRLSRSGAGVLAAGAASLLALVMPVQAVPGISGLLAPTPLGSGPGEDWRIAQCDVGQGDMLVVRTGGEEAIVVDAGPDPDPADACLETLGVEQVRVLILSHEHQDHIGGVDGVAEGRRVRQVLHGGSRAWDAAAELGLEGVTVRRAEPGASGQVAGRMPVEWRVVAADAEAATANDASAAVHFAVPAGGGQSSPTDGGDRTVDVLTLGDLEAAETRAVLDAGGLPDDVDLLKVSHHGARDGGTALITRRRPEAAVISVGEENDYGHPADVTLQALQTAGTTVYRTDEHGLITFALDDGVLRARTDG
ncbi:ComEC/Rec2 family competence protein [Nesterenkonia sp. F]|uniref:ComEC/Rec2 family competence protein n=1 Tax=Nesterenkonia sp. F TaxID=795955 RepID=UPI000255C8FA|nr:ComEC/Rec2 family competence protein [Nesterenkonia sp. F]